jgi:hypothetical protein
MNHNIRNGPDNNNKVASRWESSSSMATTMIMTTMMSLSPSSRQQPRPNGNSSFGLLVRQSSDSALVCPERFSNGGASPSVSSLSLSPTIPERRKSIDSIDAVEMECEEDGSDGEE